MYYYTVALTRGFVINLDSRADRWREASSQFSQIPFEIERISAHTASFVEPLEPFVPGAVAATWRSHQKAMQAHLNSDAQYALILEDDFLIAHGINRVLSQVYETETFDIVQLGFLTPSVFRRLIRYMIGLRDIFLKFLQRVYSIIEFSALDRLIIREQKGIPFSLVLNDIQAGGQAYLVSRKFSEAAQFMNNPSFLSADGMLMALSETRTFKVGRVRKNHIRQSNSISSVRQRFKISDK
jgi:GR25 family glycosyltransferase involved in LPS biosynthesis